MLGKRAAPVVRSVPAAPETYKSMVTDEIHDGELISCAVTSALTF